MIFFDQPLSQIFITLKEKLISSEVNDILEFEVIDPDISNEFSGTTISISGNRYIYRPFKVWTDLAEILQCKILTPKSAAENRVLIRFKVLDINRSWHNHSGADITERYGSGSEFSKIFKFEEPYFLNDFLRSLNEAGIRKGMKILDLGINRGDEFRIFNEFYRDSSESIVFTGIDHCRSALKKARSDFAADNYIFFENDFSELAQLNIPRQDLIISVGTLQSPEFDGQSVFRYLVQNILDKNGSIILGFPNSRYIDSEVVYGAKTKNYTESNLNLLIKDISIYKKYLQQHKFRVITFGKYYVFLVATRLNNE